MFVNEPNESELRAPLGPKKRLGREKEKENGGRVVERMNRKAINCSGSGGKENVKE